MIALQQEHLQKTVRLNMFSLAETVITKISPFSPVKLKVREYAYEKLPAIDLSKIRRSTCQRCKNSEFMEKKE